MKVWHKILVPPVVAIFFLLALGAISVTLMARQGLAMATLIKNRGGSMAMAMAAFQELGQAQVGVYRASGTFVLLDRDRQLAETAAQLARVDAVIKKANEYLALPNLDPEERALGEAVQPRLARYRQEVEGALRSSTQDSDSARAALQATDKSFQELTRSFTALAEMQGKLAQQSSAQGAADFRNMLVSIVGIAVFAALVCLAMAIAMARRVVRPMRTAIGQAGEIARGDLTGETVVRGTDETAELLRAQVQMKQDLRHLVADVVAGAHAVHDTSEQIAQGNVDLSQRTEEQASTLEETASSMEELTSTVQQNAANARQASELAVAASEVARKGGQAVGEVVHTMNGISDASRRISEIIGVIDGIAFQTNILALNAAVEAARAGEQGRGFAVVATEVRNLAQRSAAAAKEIKALIGDSVAKVEVGTRQVDAAGRTMEEIVGSVRHVSDLIAGIAAASQEQSAGIAQVNTAVTQMDQVVQQNATLVEEATAATESMKAQAKALLEVVARFRLAEGAAPRPLRGASFLAQKPQNLALGAM